MPQSTPNYITTTITGLVGAAFTGLISALGLDMIAQNAAASSIGSAVNSVRWHRTNISGTPTGYLSGGYTEAAGPSWLSLAAASLTLGRIAYLQTQTVDNVTTATDDQNKVIAEVVGAGPSQNRVIVNGKGESSFVQKIGVTGNTGRMTWGSFSTPGFGGTGQLNGTFAHGLGVTPSIVIFTGAAIATFAGTDSPVTVSEYGRDATNISWLARIDNGSVSNNAIVIYWVAIQ